MKYTLDQKPGPLPMFLYGLQWWVVTLPCVIIMGVIAARLHYTDAALQTFYVQKLFGLMGAVTVLQVLWGHRLPLVIGPATILLVGLLASLDAGIDAVYTAILLGGAFLTLLAAAGLLGRLRFFFTPRIVAVILILIALTMTPTILRLVLGAALGGQGPGASALGAARLGFALGMVFALLLCNSLLPGIWKSLTVLLGLLGGSVVYLLLAGLPALPELTEPAGGLPFFIGSFDPHPGTILSFLFCYLALTVNELGSVESIGQMIGAGGMEGRIRRGVSIMGLGNMAAGSLGVLGSVDYSMSAGVIGATGCASRYPLIPAGLGLLACAFFPKAILLLCSIPDAVMGALLLYLMATQLASGLAMLNAEQGAAGFSGGMTVGLPLMIGLLLSFAPAPVLEALPELLRPLLGNGFVMGTLAVVLMEHVIFRKNKGS